MKCFLQEAFFRRRHRVPRLRSAQALAGERRGAATAGRVGSRSGRYRRGRVGSARARGVSMDGASMRDSF